MGIYAENNFVREDLLEPGLHIARCYGLVHLGTIPDNYMGQAKETNKVRISWELPEDLYVPHNSQNNNPIPRTIHKEYTLSTADSANLRKMLQGWRGEDFTKEEAEKFDLTTILGKSCYLNIVHTAKKANPSVKYEDIASVSKLPKTTPCPAQWNKTLIFDFENYNETLLACLPKFVQDKIKSSKEYYAINNPGSVETTRNNEKTFTNQIDDDLPF